MREFYGLNYNKNLLNLDIYITEKCNFKCSYCYKGKSKNIDISYNNIIKCIDFIKNCKYDVVPCILGGEPLLNPNTLNILINLLEKLNNVKSITITTNGSIPIHKIKNTNKIKFIFSYHYEYFGKIKETFISNIEHCIKNNIPYLISIQYKNDIDENIKNLLKYNIYINPISDEKIQSKNFDHLMSKYNSNGKIFNERQIINLKLNTFLNYKCYLRWYNFNTDGSITPGCSNFNKVTEMSDFIICQNDYCKCGVAGLENLKCK